MTGLGQHIPDEWVEAAAKAIRERRARLLTDGWEKWPSEKVEVIYAQAALAAAWPHAERFWRDKIATEIENAQDMSWVHAVNRYGYTQAARIARGGTR